MSIIWSLGDNSVEFVCVCVSLFEASTDKDYIEPSRVFNGIQIGVSTWNGVSLEILLKIKVTYGLS